MITIITGLPGSGKTLEAMNYVSEALLQKRNVFSNISDSNTSIDNALLSYVSLSPDDWRDTPNGSFIVYDECQSLHQYSSKADISSLLLDLAKHRHTSHDLVFVSQSIKHIHPYIVQLADVHINK